MGAASAPLEFKHFPARWQAVIWRNWAYVTPAKIASLLGCDEKTVVVEAGRMGLPVQGHNVSPRWIAEGYQTIIRDNWQLLPYSQLLELLDWSPARMLHILKEEDFLWVKLGLLKPDCAPVKYTPLTQQEIEATDRLRCNLEKNMADKALMEYADEPFVFTSKFRKTAKPTGAGRPFKVNFIYAYSASCGDTFLDIDASDPLPEPLLEQYSRIGVKGVWLNAILYQLHPIAGSEEYSLGWEKRLENMHILAERCAKHGLKIYLYFNEPRGMPIAFYDRHPDWAGVEFPEKFMRANCTSKGAALAWMEQALHSVFSRVPGLGGAFFITMSENPTHCNSRLTGNKCPLCRERNGSDLVVEVLAAAERGIHGAAPNADVFAYAWSWRNFAGLDGECQDIEEHDVIRKMPPNVWLLEVSEWGKPTDVGGVQGSVRDYSIAQVGPSDKTKEAWSIAKKRGLEIAAKIQMNCSWELAAIPYLPVPYLLQEHLDNLEKEGVEALMLSWTLGGYPGANLELLKFKSVEELASAKFSKAIAPEVCKAWRMFSDAFRQFPSDLALQYSAPMNFGPLNLLYTKPTHYEATMVGFPYDDIKQWSSIYPQDVLENQFEKVSALWGKGVEHLMTLLPKVPEADKAEFDELLTMASAAYCHLRSAYMQIRFVRLRDAGRTGELPDVIRQERELAKQLLLLARKDTRVGFEASNHYFYSIQGLLEKIIQCEYLLSMEA